MPSTAYDTKGMLTSAIKDNNPVLFLEHRWLHNTKGYVPSESFSVPLSKSVITCTGTDITLVGVSYMSLECLKAAHLLAQLDISVEVIDLRSIQPIDTKTLLKSIRKTKRLLVVDHAESTCGISSEIISLAVENYGSELLSNPKRICLPPHPVPTSHVLASDYYPTASTIVRSILSTFGKDTDSLLIDNEQIPTDQPNLGCGPF